MVRDPIPYTGDSLASYRRKVYVALILAFVFHLAAGTDPKAESKAIAIKERITGTNLIGWGVVVVILTVMTDFEDTAELAVAFAFLIFIASAMAKGQSAFENIGSLINEDKSAK